jgi:hypothetical protein
MRKRAVNGKKKIPRSTKSMAKERRILFVMLIVISPKISSFYADSLKATGLFL